MRKYAIQAVFSSVSALVVASTLSVFAFNCGVSSYASYSREIPVELDAKPRVFVVLHNNKDSWVPVVVEDFTAYPEEWTGLMRVVSLDDEGVLESFLVRQEDLSDISAVIEANSVHRASGELRLTGLDLRVSANEPHRINLEIRLSWAQNSGIFRYTVDSESLMLTPNTYSLLTMQSLAKALYAGIGVGGAAWLLIWFIFWVIRRHFQLTLKDGA